MRRLFLAVLAASLMVPVGAEAQKTALSLSSGWKFGGTMGVREGDLNLAASVPYSAELAFRVRDNALGILLVEYQPTILRLDALGVNAELFNLDAWYFMVGGETEIIDRGPVVPFAIGTIGLAWFNPTEGSGNRGSETMFAGTFGGGARIPLGQSGRVSLRLEGRLNLTVPWGGASVYCSGGSGCYTGFGGTVGPVQGAVYGGLRFALGPQL